METDDELLTGDWMRRVAARDRASDCSSGGLARVRLAYIVGYESTNV